MPFNAEHPHQSDMSTGYAGSYRSGGRLIALISLVAVAVVTVAVFGLLFPAYAASTQIDAGAVEVSFEDAGVVNGGEVVVVDLEVSNPTGSEIRIESRPAYGYLQLQSGDERMSDLTSTEVQGATIPAQGSETVTIRFQIREQFRDDIETRLNDAVVTGRLPADIGGKDVRIGLGTIPVGR